MSFTMTYNNYAYAYLGAPPPAWMPRGDINLDGKVDATDFYFMCKAYGKKATDPGWDERCDLFPDGKIDASDLAFLCREYGKSDSPLPRTITITASTQKAVVDTTTLALTGVVGMATVKILTDMMRKAVKR
ncbi:MAG: dockerin type I domain-containing protein [Candidatus Bathyarchaeia archaeon]